MRTLGRAAFSDTLPEVARSPAALSAAAGRLPAARFRVGRLPEETWKFDEVRKFLELFGYR